MEYSVAIHIHENGLHIEMSPGVPLPILILFAIPHPGSAQFMSTCDSHDPDTVRSKYITIIFLHVTHKDTP